MANKTKSVNEDGSQVATGFALPNKTVRVVPLVRRDTFMGQSKHDGIFMFTGCSQSFVLPVSASRRRLIDPLTEEERMYLEEELKVDLNTSHPDNYYKTLRITIKKTSENLESLYLELDLNNPLDYLYYKVLLQVPTVANTWEERDNSFEYEWAIREIGQEFEQKVTIADMKTEAYTWLSNVGNSKDKMRNYLRVYGVKIAADASVNELKSQIHDLIETPDKLRKLLELIQDKDFEHKLFIEKAIQVGEIHRTGTSKYALKGGDSIGNTLSQAVDYIKDKMNSVIVAGIRDKIEANKV